MKKAAAPCGCSSSLQAETNQTPITPPSLRVITSVAERGRPVWP
jgi:hypothetical protein